MILSSTFKDINTCWEQKKTLHALGHTLLALPISEFFEGFFHAVSAAIKAPVAPIKLPLSFLSLRSKDETLSKLHKEFPGITDVLISAFKAAICFVNVFWAPILGIISPEENLKYHEMCGLIKDIDGIKDKPTKNFSDIAGMEALKKQIQQEVISPVKDKASKKKYGIKPPKGILLYGPPGCGKTHIAECIAGELEFKFKPISVGNIGSIFIYGSVGKIKTVFEDAKKEGPIVLFFDDFDGLIGKRENLSEGTGATAKSLKGEIAEFLTQLDQVDPNKVIVIAATNFPAEIDPAILRTGRFDKKIEITPPNQEARKKLIEHYVKDLEMSEGVLGEVDYELLSQKTDGYSCSDLKVFVATATRNACASGSMIATETFISILKSPENVNPPKKDFSHIAGMETFKKQISTELINPLQDDVEAPKWGIHPPNGVLLYGPPGCGKTHLAECLAGELGFNFRHLSSSSTGSTLLHGSAKKIKEVFEEARKSAPCVLFLDDLDGIAGNRENLEGGNSQAFAGEITEFLTQLDQNDPRKVVVIAATNHKENIDAALTRRGRFDLQIEIDYPDQEARQKLIEYYVKNSGINNEVVGEINYKDLSQKTKDYSCSDLKALVEKAAREAFAKKEKMLTTKSFLTVIMEKKGKDAKTFTFYHL